MDELNKFAGLPEICLLCQKKTGEKDWKNCCNCEKFSNYLTNQIFSGACLTDADLAKTKFK